MAELMENELLNIAVMISVVWIIRRFWGSFYEKKKRSAGSVSLWTAYCIFLFFFGYRGGQLQMLATILNVLFIFGIAAVSYKSAGRGKYFLLAAFLAGWCLLEVLVYSLLNGLSIAEGEKQDILGLVLSISFMAVFVYALSIMAGRRKAVFAAGTYGLLLLLIPIGSIVAAVNEFCFQSRASVITVSILLLFNIVVFEFYLKINETFAYEREREDYARQSDLMGKTTASQKKMLEEFYAEKHDLQNQLIVLKDSIDNGDREAARRTLNQMMKTGSASERISHTGNSTVDSLLNFKYAIAKEYGIAFCLHIFIPQELPVEQGDMGIVLGNALDNAMEAVKGCTRHERRINLSMGVKKQALVILIQNPYEHALKTGRDGRYQSTKTDSRRHGYGLNSIAGIAEKYQGSMLAEAEDSYFSLTIILNLPEI